LTQEEFVQNKLEGRYPLNSVPVLFVQGHVLVETSSIIRLLARTNKGRNGETLYPGNEDPMLAYEMDVILDSIAPHTDYVAKFMHPAFGIVGDKQK
jgi:glutathione S-transferase